MITSNKLYGYYIPKIINFARKKLKVTIAICTGRYESSKFAKKWPFIFTPISDDFQKKSRNTKCSSAEEPIIIQGLTLSP